MLTEELIWESPSAQKFAKVVLASTLCYRSTFQGRFGLLTGIDIDVDANSLFNLSILVSKWYRTYIGPAIAAVSRAQAKLGID